MPTPSERLEAALAGRYRIERELGAGGMATVYLAHDLKHERDVALKVLRPELGAVLGAERFLAEIKITARLDHPHIFTLIDSGAVDGLLYYVMPFARGESLRDRLNREHQLSIEEALSITSQVASALDYAHRQGVIHRDIKPENILMQEGEAMLTDFGIALAVKEAGGNRLTETGLSLGTPQYMSPEQATGDRVLDARSDVYSLAAVLYEMLAGEPPVTGPNAQAMIAKLMVERPTSLRVVRDTVSEGLDAVVAKALAKAPADRFTGTAEFAKALATSALPTGALAVASPTRKRSRRRSALIVGAVALVAAVIGYLALQGPRARTSASSPFATAIPAQLTTTGTATNGIPSPDGSQLAYSEFRCDAAECRAELLIRETAGEGVSTIFAKAGHIATPVRWSPDGRWVLFSDADESGGDQSGWYVVSQRGGVPRRLGRSHNTLFSTMDFVAPDTLVMVDANGPDYWLRRLDVGTGQVVDSLPLPMQGTILDLAASPDGRRLLVTSVGSLTPDSATLHLVSRAAEVTDSIRIGFAFDGASFAGALWSGPHAVIIATTINGRNGLVATRWPLDDRGRFIDRADTLTVIPDGRVVLSGMSRDGSRLFYSQTRLGELAFWTAARSEPRAPYVMGRRVAGSTGDLYARLSPGGRWIFLSNALGALRTKARVEVEAFDTGERQVVESALSSLMDFAFLPGEDSLILATQGLLTGPLVFTSYPLEGGSSVRWGSFDRISIIGGAIDLGSISDGHLATPVKGRSIRVFTPSGEVSDYPVPDSLGDPSFSRPSPASPEVAVGSVRFGDAGATFAISRCNLLDGRCTLLARTRELISLAGGTAVWSDDGWVRLPLTSVSAVLTGDVTAGQAASIYRVSIEGGEFERETVLGLMPGSSIAGMSRDGRRALVSVQSATSDLWVLRAGPPR